MGKLQWPTVLPSFTQCTRHTHTSVFMKHVADTYIPNHLAFFIQARLIQSSEKQLHVLCYVVLCMQQ